MAERTVEITCVIPTHERPELLQQSVGSVIQQTTTRPYELLVVDDALGLETERVVNEAAQSSPFPIRYLGRDFPRGASASRNVAMTAARGDVFAFLDDDDLWDPRFLEVAVEALETTGADMAVVWLNVLDLDGTIEPFNRMPAELPPAAVAARNPGFTGSNFVIRRVAFEALNGFDVALPVSNDKDFLLRFLLGGFRYTVVPQYLAIHRRHQGPQLTAGDERRARGVEAYLHKHNSVLTWNGKRHLRGRVHRIRMRTAETRLERTMHAAGFAASLSVTDLVSKWRRRGGRYSDLR